MTSSAVAGDGVIYIGSNGRLGGKSPEDGRLYALDAKTGKILNNFQAKNEELLGAQTRCTSVTSPGTCTVWTPRRSKRSGRSKPTGRFEGAQHHKNLVFIGSGAGDNQMYALRQDDGKVFEVQDGGKMNRIL